MDIFNALGQPRRRHIVELLANRGQMSSTAIAKNFRVTPPAISQHLKVLRQAHLVRMEKHRQQHLYQLNPIALTELEYWAKKLAEQWQERFNRLDALLQEEKKKILKSYHSQLKKK